MNQYLDAMTKQGRDVNVAFKNGVFILACDGESANHLDFGTAAKLLYNKFLPPKNWDKLQGFGGESIKCIGNYTSEDHDGFVIYFNSGRKIYVTADMGQGIGYVIIGVDHAP